MRTDSEHVSELIRQLESQKLEILSVIQYGSTINDLDLLVLTFASPFMLQTHDRVDAMVISSTEAIQRAQWRDIAITEPVLKGTTIYGDDEHLAKLRTKLDASTVSGDKIVKYLTMRALIENVNAAMFLHHAQMIETMRKYGMASGDVLSPFLGVMLFTEELQSDLEHCLQCLTYSSSYLFSSQLIEKNRRDVPEYEQILGEYPLAREIHDYLKSHKKYALDKVEKYHQGILGCLSTFTTHNLH